MWGGHRPRKANYEAHSHGRWAGDHLLTDRYRNRPGVKRGERGTQFYRLPHTRRPSPRRRRRRRRRIRWRRRRIRWRGRWPRWRRWRRRRRRRRRRLHLPGDSGDGGGLGGPSGPAAPDAPAAPSGPAAPGAPDEPSGPDAPSGQAAPAAPGGPGGPGAPSAPTGPGHPPHQADPGHQEDPPLPAHPPHQAAQVHRAHPAVQSDPTVPHQADPTRLADRTTIRQEHQVDPMVTSGDHRGTQAITTGMVSSKAPRGVKVCPHGVTPRHRGLRGTDRCPRRGDRLRHRSTTAALMSSRFGIPAISNGASGSSGSGFLSRADPAVARAALRGQFT